MYKIECFKLRVSESGSDPLDLKSAVCVHDVRCEFPSFRTEPITIAADPFLFVRDDTLFLFYERKTMYSKAVIVMECTKDLVNWTEPVVVLSEDYHLSFPFVFEENGHIYMIPEACASNSVRLYEADNENLTHFSYQSTLLLDDSPEKKIFSYSDSSVLKEQNQYYLFTSYRNLLDQDITELYVADSLFGPYRMHPSSPISVSNRYARCAGSILTIGDRRLRFVQDCEKRYGDDVHVMQINQISPDVYSESVFLQNMIPAEERFYREGGHQYNSVMFHGRRIIATDAKEYHYFIVNHALHRVSRMIRKKASDAATR